VHTLDLTAPCPRLRPTADVARVDVDGQTMICVYDRQDPGGSQVLIGEFGLFLASLFDGHRTPSAVCAAFALRTRMAIAEQQVVEFVRQLDGANLLDSERFRARLAESVAAFRAAPVRPAVHAGGAYPDDPLQLRRFLDSRYTAEGGPGGPPSAPRGPSLRGLVAPHIDLHRGGHSYAWGYREVAEREPADLYVVLGTCHLPMESPFAATAKPYDTPLGPVPTDREFVDRLARRLPFDLLAEEYAHRAEHSVEFQAVYLRYLSHASGKSCPAIVPLLCVPPHDLADGATPRESPPFAEALEALRQTIAEDGRRICVVAGVDFAHVGPQFGDPAPVDSRFAEHVETGDRTMLDLIARGDADGFYHQVVHEAPGPGMAGEAEAVGGPRRICGLAPIYVTLHLLGRSDGRVLHYDQWIDQSGAGAVTFGCVAIP
jgi:MEMO1 family protein